MKNWCDAATAGVAATSFRFPPKKNSHRTTPKKSLAPAVNFEISPAAAADFPQSLFSPPTLKRNSRNPFFRGKKSKKGGLFPDVFV